MSEEITFTSVQISTDRRRQLEQLRLKMTAERSEMVILRDALDAAIAAGLDALQDTAPEDESPQPAANGIKNG